MQTWRRALMEIPEAQRLETALFWLEEMTGGEQAVAAVQRQFRFSASVARVVAALNAAFPRFLTKEQLYRALYPRDDEAQMKIVDVYICKARAKMPPGSIITHRGLGFSLSAPLQIDVVEIAPRPFKHAEDWTEDDDADLLRMHATGSDYAAMAEELDRSPRAIEIRLQVLRERGKLFGPVRRSSAR